MFEKEAESYATRECCRTCNNVNHFCKEKCECWTFAKKGAEFGYNNANEWHDLRKDTNDIPKDYRYVWTNVGPSYYDLADHCWRDDFGRTQGVIAWCEPKFEE